MEKTCRLCGELSNKLMHNIFDKNESGQQLIQLIKQCLPILVYRTDPLSKVICESCYLKLNDYSSFQRQTVETLDKFKLELSARIDEYPVKLYLDTLENAFQPETIQITNLRSPRPVRNSACQIRVETRSNYTNTILDEVDPISSPCITPVRSLKILTPSLINEKSSETNIFVSLQSEDGTIQKKRRLAGPKSKTRREVFSPQTLLQYALKQINKNLNLTEDNSSDLTSELIETETDYSASRSESQEDIYSSESLLEPVISMSVLDYKFSREDFYSEEPAMCNYCMKNFPSMSQLAFHEIKHIKVDIGPRCDTREYGQKCRKFVGYYQNYIARLNAPDEIIPTKIREVRGKPELRPKIKNITKINPWHERTQHVVDDPNSLLVPKPKDDHNFTFTVENYEVLVNGVSIKSMTKDDRRACFRDIVINDKKRKFCPICRHTFKDNWATESHYMTDMCQYTCKYCGRKFKNQSDLFEQHLKQHKGEPVNKVFGPTDRRFRFKKKIKTKNNRSTLTMPVLTAVPKMKPVKLKALLQQKKIEPPVKIKTEPGLETANRGQPPSTSNNNRARTEPYQAYFCRKCFKVFFNVNEYNKHIRTCTGNSRKSSKSSDKSENSAANTPEPNLSQLAQYSRRPMRSCVKEIAAANNDSSDVDSDEIAPKKGVKPKVQGSPEKGYECGICCSSFPSKFSRNSHMRIHKGQIAPKPTINKVVPKSHTITKQEPPPTLNHVPPHMTSDIRLSNLNPAVARLVQNNPHLTIRTYSKSQYEKQQEIRKQAEPPSPKMAEIMAPNSNESTPEHNIKRVYKCGDCEDKFENKSVLYYHKMNSCIVKRHYECAFCKKKFGTYDQYNTHMFYVHPE